MKTAMEREPAPALIRGLHLLRLIAATPATLESLVRGTGIPRSSLARMLIALSRAGVAERDNNRQWRAIVHVEACAPAQNFSKWLPLLEDVVSTLSLRAELWNFTVNGPVLVSSADPDEWPIRLFAYPGWHPDCHELLGPTILWWGNSAEKPAPRAWHWKGNQRHWLSSRKVRTLVDAARRAGASSCPSPIHNNTVRHAVILPNNRGALVAVSIGNRTDVCSRLFKIIGGKK